MDPIGLDSSVNTTHTLTDVAVGSYSVSAMAENENGMSQDVTASFVVQGMYVLSSIQVCGLYVLCVFVVLCVWYISMLGVLYYIVVSNIIFYVCL